MFGFSKLAIGGLLLATSLLAAGCATDNTPAQSSLATTDKGVTCTKCNVTWTKIPIEAGGRAGRVIGYYNKKSMECPDCKDAVSNFFATGKLQHTCKTCGDSMEICEKH